MEVQTPTPGNQPVAPSPAPPTPKQRNKLILRAVDRLGLPRSRWERSKVLAIQELGHLFDTKITARVALVGSFDGLDQVQLAAEWAKGILAKPDDKTTFKDKLAAATVINMCAKSYGELAEKAVAFAEKSADRVELARPKNLPPTVALQVNVGGAQPSPAPPTPANNGNGESHSHTIETENPASTV